MRFRIVFLGGVYPPFKQLKHNFLPIFGLFWASLVFLFTCLVFNMLHYMNNVMQQNGCFPLLVRVSGLFAILPVIIPSFLPSFLSFPSFAFFWFFGLGPLAGPWAAKNEEQKNKRTKQQRTKKNKEEQRDWNKGAF